jgi:hypothetical protein
MSAAAALDLASIPERIQSEVQRPIQRSIRGVEYIASSGPALGSPPKDTLHVRGTMMWRRSAHRWRPAGFQGPCSDNRYRPNR